MILDILATDAWTAAGRGVEALVDAVMEGRPRVRAVEGVPVPIAARTDAADVYALLDAVVAGVLPPVRGDRVGLVVGTSSGAISGDFEAWTRAGHPPEAELEWRQAPTRRIAERYGLAPHTTVSAACASSTAAFAVAEAWLRAGRCDRVVVAGVDAWSVFVHAGFAGLGALGPRGARPFAPDRDGLLLGEGAAAVLLAPRAPGVPARATLLGQALTQDAWHLTAPEPAGSGLGRCIAAALAASGLGPEAVDAASAHGTGTRLNDVAEARAWGSVFAEPVPLHAIKGVVGHTLGAAGMVELVLLVAALNGAPLPPPPAVEGLRTRTAGAVRVGISVNAAFGGLNAAVVVGVPALGSPRAVPGRSSPVQVSALAELEAHTLPLSTVWPGAPAALGRADRYVRAGVQLLRSVEVPPGALLLFSSASTCRAADLRHQAGILARGPAGASRLHFPYTIPGAPLAEGAIAAGLTGPALVLADTPEVTDALAHDLVVAGVAPSVVVVRVEAPSDDPQMPARGKAYLCR